jgi:hypothetical protein
LKRNAFLVILLLVAGAVAFFSYRSFRDTVQEETPGPPSLGPSLMSFEYTGTEAFPKLGLQDSFEADANIEKVVELGDKAMPRLMELCRTGTDAEKIDALKAAYRISPSDAVMIAREMLDDKSPAVISVALYPVGRKADGGSKASVVKLTAHHDEKVRARAVTALALIEPELETIRLLRDLWKDKSAFVRDSVAKALDAITFSSFGLTHSGYDSDNAAALAKLDAWVGANASKGRILWLDARVREAIEGLTTEDPWVMYASDQFLRSVMGETGFDWSLERGKRLSIAESLRDKWKEYVPLFMKAMPNMLEISWE